MSDDISAIGFFNRPTVRRVHHKGQWWFAVNDVIGALTGVADPYDALKKTRRRDPELGLLFLGKSSQLGALAISPPERLMVTTKGGVQPMFCWHAAGILRLIQSINGAKAEPLKRWLAQVGVEHLLEVAGAELTPPER